MLFIILLSIFQSAERITVIIDKQKNQSITWSTIQPPTTGHQNSANVIRKRPGRRPAYTQLASTYTAWSPLIDEELISTIVSPTNKKIVESIARISEIRKATKGNLSL